MTAFDVARLREGTADAAGTFQLDEEAFRTLYDRTAHALWGYLARISGSATLADDLLQETYYRFLRSRAACMTDAHRRNYLFRIGTNLVRDRLRRPVSRERSLAPDDQAVDPTTAEDSERRVRHADLDRAMARLKLRDRQILWLAYAEGSSHVEIAEALGLRARSVRVMLFRARRRLARLLGAEV